MLSSLSEGLTRWSSCLQYCCVGGTRNGDNRTDGGSCTVFGHQIAGGQFSHICRSFGGNPFKALQFHRNCTREGPLTIVPQTDVSSARRRGGDPLLFEPIVVHLLSLLLFIFPYRIGAQDQDVMPSIELKQAYDGPEISRTMRAILPFLLRSARTGHLNGTITEPTASLR